MWGKGSTLIEYIIENFPISEKDCPEFICNYNNFLFCSDKKARNSKSFSDHSSKSESVSHRERNTTASLVATLQEFVGLDLCHDQGTLEDMTFQQTENSATYSSHRDRFGEGYYYSCLKIA